MEPQRVTLIAKAHNGMISIRTEIPVPDEADTYVVKIGVTSRSVVETAARQRVLDAPGERMLPSGLANPASSHRE